MPSSAVSVKRGLKDIEVRIPLETLGRPERLLVSARTYIGDISLDWVSWRVVDLHDEKR